MYSQNDVIAYIHLDMGIHFFNKRKSLEQTKFFSKRASFRKNRTMDEHNGSFKEMKKIIVFKRTILNRSNDFDHSQAVFLLN